LFLPVPIFRACTVILQGGGASVSNGIAGMGALPSTYCKEERSRA
jgi:hypothetical protein